MNKKHLLSIICIFLALIFVPSIVSIATGQSDFSAKENRALQIRPDSSLSSIMDGSFQKDYEAYLSDQFMLRDYWVTAKTTAFRLLGKKDINNIYLGKDGYLIEKYTDSDFDDNQIKINNKLLCDFLNSKADCGQYNSVCCAFVPSKGTVLQNMLPSGAKPYNSDFVVDDVCDKTSDNVNVLYFKDALSSHNDEYIFYRTDHHWTSLGAYYGYKEYCNSVGIAAPELGEYKQTLAARGFLGTDYDKLQAKATADEVMRFDYNGVNIISVDYNGDADNSTSLYIDANLKEKDKYTYFLGGNYYKINIKTNSKSGKKLLLIKDSFSNSLIPFLARDYSEIVMLDLRYSKGKVDKVMQEEKGITDILVLYNTEKYMNDNHQFALK